MGICRRTDDEFCGEGQRWAEIDNGATSVEIPTSV
jgi:hypothetical protein